MDEIIHFGYYVQGYKEKKMTFCKYEFLSETEWATFKAQITDQDGNPIDCAIVELGNICLERDADGNCINLSPFHAVDIWWADEPLESFNAKEVTPPPTGVHTFAGMEYLYLQRFCKLNPDSPYCVIPE